MGNQDVRKPHGGDDFAVSIWPDNDEGGVDSALPLSLEHQLEKEKKKGDVH